MVVFYCHKVWARTSRTPPSTSCPNTHTHASESPYAHTMWYALVLVQANETYEKGLRLGSGHHEARVTTAAAHVKDDNGAGMVRVGGLGCLWVVPNVRQRSRNRFVEQAEDLHT